MPLLTWSSIPVQFIVIDSFAIVISLLIYVVTNQFMFGHVFTKQDAKYEYNNFTVSS